MVRAAFHRSVAPLVLLGGFALGFGCAEPTFGEGVGVPSISIWDINEYDILPLEISAVDRSAPDPEDWELTLDLTTDQDVQLDALMLCAEIDCLDLGGKLEGAENFSLEGLSRLEEEVGAIAVVDTERFWVHAIYAWGADPRTTGHPWGSVADAAGVLDEEAPFESVCFPVESAPCDRQQQIRIDAIKAGGVRTSVEVTNESGTRLPLRGLGICVGQTCQRLNTRERLPAGDSLEIVLSGALPDDAFDLRAAELVLDDASEVLLVAPGGEDPLADSDSRWMSYVVYGGPGALQESAVDAGLWNDDNAFAASPANSEVLRFTGADPADPSDWTTEAH